MELEIRLLGPTEVLVDGKPADLGGGRQRRLLAALAIDGGAVVSADRLIDRVWASGDLPANPRAALRTYLTRLRQAIGGEGDGPIVTETAGWRLEVERASCDITHFEDLVAAAADLGLDVHERLARFDRALALWRGRALEEVADDDWARAEVDRLEELRVTALERRYEAMLAAGMHTDALPGLTGDVEQHPFRDRLVGLQMLALFRAGRQAEACQVFQDHRTRLGQELGLEPSDELIDLDRRILTADPSLQLGPVAGRALRGYRLGEQLGEGAFAVVYRGTQPSVGRDVAVKIIRSELANRPEFIRRFEAEAHLVARLEHPYIVPVYDYWREPDRACLVFRYLRGGTLEARLTGSGGLSIEEAGRLVEQMSSALAVAHQAGVVHRDVKPANVFLDEAGNFYLGDFGIALEATELSDPTAALSAGSPAYAAPEQLRRETIGPAADVHALAITTFEALTVRLPFPDADSHADLLHRQLHDPIPSARALRADLPPEVDEVLSRATAKDPAERYGSIDDFARAFAAAIAPDGEAAADAGSARRGATTAVSSGLERNPFKGLRAFTEADAADFRGRERLVDRLIDLLNRPVTAGRIAAVVGPSGIGKSSVVRAGLLPALRQGAAPGSDQWFVATILPGRDPFEELGSALLRIATTVPDNMMNLLDQDHRGLARVVKALVPEDSETEVLLIIDQFEELFTLVEDEARRHLFLEAIEHAVTDSRCPLRVVLTMRADFWDRPLRHGSFARLIEHSVVNVTALAPDELERAITEPAAATGCEFEPGLVSEIVADVADEPGALPLLQYALTELWERRVSGLLTRDAYRELGGVAGALARRAEELHEASTDAERTAIRRLFGRLVSVGEGTEDTRRRALRSELTLVDGADGLIDRFGGARLLSFDRDPATREPTVEVAHEALIREWPRLGGWLEEDRDDLRLHRHLETAAAEWEAAGRPDSELYRGGRLEAAEDYAATHRADLSDREHTFLAGSIGQRDAEEAAEQERFDAQVRNNRRLRALLTGVGVLLVLALIAGGLAFQQRGQANLARDDAQAQAQLAAEREEEAVAAQSDAERIAFDAETRRLVADAIATTDSDVDVALLLAAEAYRRQPGPGTLAGLQGVLTSTGPYLGALGRGRNFLAADWLDDGTIVGLTDTSVVLYDGESRQMRAELPLDAPVAAVDGATVQVAFDVSGQSIAVGTSDGSVAIIDTAGQAAAPGVASIDVSTAALSAVEFSPNGDQIAAADVDGALYLVDRVSGATRWRTNVIPERSFADVMTAEELAAFPNLLSVDDLIFATGPRAIAFEPTGSILVAAGVHFRRLDQTTGELLAEQVIRSPPNPPLPAIPRTPVALHVREDGSIAAIAGSNGYVELDPALEPTTMAIIPTGRNLTTGTSTFTFGPDGRPTFGLDNGQIVTGTVESITDDAARQVTGLATVGSLATADGRGYLLAAGLGGMEFWALDGRQLLGRAVPRGGNNELLVAADGLGAIVTNSGLGLDSLTFDLSAEPPRPVEVPPSIRQLPLRYVPTPDATPIAVILDGLDNDSGVNRIRLLDRQTMETIGEVRGGMIPTMSDDGETTVWAFEDGTVARFQFPSGEMIGQPLDTAPWRGSDRALINNLDLDATSQRLLISMDSGVTRLYEVDDWRFVAEIAPSDENPDEAVTARFLPDGQTVVTRSRQGQITLRDASSLAPLRNLPAGALATESGTPGPHVSDDGEYLLTTRDQEPRLIHLPTGRDVGSFPNDPGLVAGADDSGTMLQLMTGVGDHGIVWNLDLDTWFDVACRAAGRNLTEDEWERLGPSDTPWTETCPQWSSTG